MGKVKNQRHRMVGAGGGFAQGAPARTLFNLGNTGVDLSGLEANLSSIHENKRVQACQLISDICKLNGHSSKVMDKVSNKKILSKFNLLLVDHSLRVKHAAFVTLQILSSVGNSDVVGRLVSSGIFRTALTVATETTDFSCSTDLLDIKQNALYSVANVISSQPAAVQEVIQHNIHFFDFLLNSTSADGNISILNTCLNVLNILSRSAKHDQLINHVLGQRAISVVQQLMNTLLQEKMSIDPSTNTVLLTVQAISTTDQDVWIVIIQCLEILSNFYINAVSSVEVQQAIDARNVVNIAVQLLALAANGISAVQGSISRENDFVEMLSEFFSNLCTKVSGYIQGLEDGNGKLREPSDRSLHIRYMYMGSLLSTTRTPTSDSVSAFLAVLQHLQVKLQSQMMTAEAYSQYQASQQTASADEEEVMLADDADPDMAVTNPATAGVAARTMSRNLMGASYVLSHDAFNTVLVMEKAQSALGDLLALQTSLVMIPSELPPLPSSGFVQWDTFFAQAKFLQDALHNTTPSMDEASRKATEGWMTAEEEDLMPLKSSIITQCVTFFDIMTALISHSAASLPSDQCVWVITEEQLRSLVVLLLQWLSTPQLEICLSVLATISSFAKEQWCGSSTFPVALFGVVTNALINRLRQPTAYSTSSTRDSSTGTQVTLNKSQNVQRATILLLDAVFNAVIDMNSNDHLAYHQTFARMNIATLFAQEHEQLMQRVQSNIFLLSESERDQLEDTLANIEGLLEYKRTNFR